MAHRRAVILALAAALACLAVGASAQRLDPATKPDELRYNGNANGQSADGQSADGQSTDGQSTDGDTTIIEDRPQRHQQRPQQQVQPPFRPAPFEYGNRRPPSGGLFDALVPGFGFGGGFGGGFDDAMIRPAQIMPPRGLLQQFLGGGLFDTLDRHAQDLNKHFEQEFTNLERQAAEGKDVSYFNRNGVEYVRTCTTRRLDRGERPQQQNQVMLLDGDQQQQQQQQQQQPPLEGQSAEMPVPPSQLRPAM